MLLMLFANDTGLLSGSYGKSVKYLREFIFPAKCHSGELGSSHVIIRLPEAGHLNCCCFLNLCPLILSFND